MATWDVTAATDYIRENTLDNEDFIAADDSRKKALLNVAQRTLNEEFPDLAEAGDIDDETVYEFAAVLGAQYNDTMRQRIRGAQDFSIDDFSISFAGGGTTNLSDLIPKEIYDRFGKSKRGVKWTII
ncbi:hypothetical protein [Salibacterium lacus]|uniref:Uncharacterized protein n=1 Tax=Salibacterium lacus TaxID=1898109 RepID=A0ABW5SXY2_9BACI